MADLFGELSSEESEDGNSPREETTDNIGTASVDGEEEEVEDMQSENVDGSTWKDDVKEDGGEGTPIITEEGSQRERRPDLWSDPDSSDEEHKETMKKHLSSAQDLFGEDSSSSGGDETTQVQSTVKQEDLFGEAGDISSEDEGKTGQQEVRELQRMGDDPMDETGSDIGLEEPPPPEEVTTINVDIPRSIVDTATELHYVKLPNFLSVETRPFDANLYEDEIGEDEVLDEEGRARLKLKVENTIRWRYIEDEDGNTLRESNAKMVKWSDGTMSLFLGGEIFDVYKQLEQGRLNHLFVRQGTGLQGHSIFRSKLTFRPHSTESATHKKMTLSIADRFSRAQKIRVLASVGKDPETQRSEMIKKEEERLRATSKRVNKQKRMREKSVGKTRVKARDIEPDFINDEDDEEEGESLAAIVQSVRSNYTSVSVSDEEDDEDDDDDEDED